MWSRTVVGITVHARTPTRGYAHRGTVPGSSAVGSENQFQIGKWRSPTHRLRAHVIKRRPRRPHTSNDTPARLPSLPRTPTPNPTYQQSPEFLASALHEIFSLPFLRRPRLPRKEPLSPQSEPVFPPAPDLPRNGPLSPQSTTFTADQYDPRGEKKLSSIHHMLAHKPRSRDHKMPSHNPAPQLYHFRSHWHSS